MSTYTVIFYITKDDLRAFEAMNSVLYCAESIPLTRVTKEEMLRDGDLGFDYSEALEEVDFSLFEMYFTFVNLRLLERLARFFANFEHNGSLKAIIVRHRDFMVSTHGKAFTEFAESEREYETG